MCGIAGWIDFHGGAANPSLLQGMLQQMVHRGPDADGLCERGPMHFGHRRLSIIDLETGGQPMSNEDGTVWITFNGEIYDYQNLRQTLIEKGHRFKTKSDTETIIHAYEEYGERCVDRLRGQFAFAIWDERKQELFIARDRLGQKPLYYFAADGQFIFASTLTSLVQHTAIPTRLCSASVHAYLQMSYVPEGMCILEGVSKLRPGHTALVSRQGVAIRTYWSPNFEDKQDIDEPHAIERLDELLCDATRMRMVADVPVGAFLSGGIDSSLVVAAMRRTSNADIHTFSIGFEDEEFDERRYAREVAQRFETRHQEFVVSPDAATDLTKIAAFFDEPFADSSAFAVYYLAELTRQYVTVALNGDGGDESFAGYDRYWGLEKFSRFRKLPTALIRLVTGMANLATKTPLRDNRTLRRLVDWAPALQLSAGKVYELTVAIHPDSVVELIEKPAAAAMWNEIERFVNDHSASSLIDRAMFADQMTYLPGDLLVKVDRMTMAHSLEARSPLLDHHLMEFAASLPNEVQLKGGRQKHLLKQLLNKYLPLEFIERPKQGFGVPIESWFRSDIKHLLREWTEDSLLIRDGIVDAQSVFRLRDAHWGGQVDHSRALWTFINLEFWYANFFSTVVGERSEALGARR